MTVTAKEASRTRVRGISGLPRQLAADEPLGNFRRQVNAGRFPLGEPRLLGLVDVNNRLSQGGNDRGKLPLNHLVDLG